MDRNMMYAILIIFFIILITLQGTLNKIYKELKEIKQIMSRNKIN